MLFKNLSQKNKSGNVSRSLSVIIAPIALIYASMSAQAQSELLSEKTNIEFRSSSFVSSSAGASKTFAMDFSSDHQPNRNSSAATRLKRNCQVPLPSLGSLSPFPIALRLGVMLSPNTKFVGGADVTLNGLKLLPGFSSRIDADVFLDLNRRGVSTLIPVTFDQLYTKNIALGSRIYFGGGIGAYIGSVTRFGGKVFVGAGLKSNLGIEGTAHFYNTGEPLLTVQARVSL